VSSIVATDLYRVVLVTPTSSAEIALPASVPVGDLLPALVHHSGASKAGTPEYEQGWVLQRLGEAPLDEEATPATLGIREGETLYLRPASTQMPAAQFDDLIDGIATGIGQRRDQWSARLTRWLFLAVCGGALAVGLWESATGWLLSAGAVVTVLLLLGAAACSRAMADRPAALLLAVASVPYAGWVGLAVPAAPGASLLSAPGMLCAGVAMTLTALLALVAVGDCAVVFGSIAAASGGAIAGGMLGTLAGMTGVRSAALVLGLAVVLGTVTPVIAFRLARLALPMLPTGADDLNEDIEPIPGPELLARAALADRYVTGMFAALGAVAAGAMTALVRSPGWLPGAIVTAAAVLLLIRSRVLQGSWQRLAVLSPAGYGLAALLIRGSHHYQGLMRLAVLEAPLVGVAVMALVFSHVLPGRRLHPIWGRLADISEWMAGIALVPLILAEAGVFAWARGLGG
jgi:type VII secretion integral membrane protein EccD